MPANRGHVAPSPLLRRGAPDGRSHQEESSGDSVRATSSDVTTAAEMVRPNGRKKIPDHVAHQPHRQEHGNDRQRRRRHRQADLVGGGNGRLARRIAAVDVPLDVLHVHDRVVHDDADHEREREQCQRLEAEAGQLS